jgi:hypothetical protein
MSNHYVDKVSTIHQTDLAPVLSSQNSYAITPPKYATDEIPSRAIPASIEAPQPLLIQPKLTVNAADDKYEREADTVANSIAQHNIADVTNSPHITHIQRQADANASAVDVSGGFESQLDVERGRGAALAADVRSKMEKSFGTDFSAVRIHDDAKSDALNRSIQAQAFTRGNDVFFRRAAYKPESADGQKLLAHELTHVVQQRRVPDAHPSEYIQREIYYRDGSDGSHPTDLTNDDKKAGKGERNVKKMLADYRHRDFKNKQELLDYANQRTTTIGYVEREKVWVRLPDTLFVLGESHNATTTPDIAEATQVPFRYEGGTAVSYITHKPDSEHVLESSLPKIAGLLEQIVEGLGNQRVHPHSRRRLDKEEIKDVKTDNKVNLGQDKKINSKADANYKKRMVEWNKRMEQARLVEGSYFKEDNSKYEIREVAPKKAYSNSINETKALLQALQTVQDAQLPQFQNFYKTHNSIIKTTISELKNYTPVQLTNLYLKALDKDSVYQAMQLLVTLFKNASAQEITDRGLRHLPGLYPNNPQYTWTSDVTLMKQRDQHIIHYIREELNHTQRAFLIGMGDKHVKNMKPWLDKKQIQYQSMKEFVDEHVTSNINVQQQAQQPETPRETDENSNTEEK